jgi:peptide deformylase
MDYKTLIEKTADLPQIPIVYFENDEKVLRKESIEIPVDQITTPEFKKFLDKLDAAMKNEPLMPGWIPGGISAIQIDVPLQVFISLDSNTDEYEYFINPKVEMLGTAQDTREEGCLSFPDTVIKVRRHKRIRVTYYNREGELVRKKYSGWNARVIQHEYDHLLGILFVDKAE